MKPDNSNYKIVQLSKENGTLFKKLIHLFNEVFETKNSEYPDESYLIKLLEKTGFIAYAIIINNEVIGGLTAYELPLYYKNCTEVYIYDMAVKPQFQRQGLGKKLIEALKDYCRIKNIKLVFVEAHEEDIHAVDFYRSIGGQAEKVVHFNFPL
jgi:aminoglycoside 3-N-acetyltransferase I